MGILLTPQKLPFYIHAHFIIYTISNLSNCQETLLVHKARYLIHTGWMSSHYIRISSVCPNLAAYFKKNLEELMCLEYIILSLNDICISANIEKVEFFFLKSKQSCQNSCLSLTHIYYGFIIYLVTTSARPPFLLGWLGEPLLTSITMKYLSAAVAQKKYQPSPFLGFPDSSSPRASSWEG